MIDKKIKALYEAKHGDLVNILVDIIKYQDDRISDLEKIEKSKYATAYTIQINEQNTITKDEFIQNIQCNSDYVDIQDYNKIIISVDFIISEVLKTFKEITENIMNNETMTDVEFHYIKQDSHNIGYRLDFAVFINRNCDINYNNYIKFIDGKLEIKLCEAIERCGIENEMITRLSNLSQYLLEIDYPDIL